MHRSTPPNQTRGLFTTACAAAFISWGAFAFGNDLASNPLSAASPTDFHAHNSRSGQGLNGVPKSLLAKFTSGVNVTRWFCYLSDPNDTAHFQSYFTEGDFSALKQLHVHFIRLCVSPGMIYDNGHINANNWPYLVRGLKRIQAHGLGVILDLHDNGQMKLDDPGHDNSGFVSFWKQVSQKLKGIYEDGMVFETVNEPQFNKNGSVWYALLNETASTIRREDPHRTILATGTGWDGIDDLKERPVLPLKNVIYSAHSYDPFFFTHQGASWVGAPPKDLKSVPFPSSPEAVDAILDQNPDSEKGTLMWYGKQHFDAKYVLGRMELMTGWGKKHGVPMLLGEFGSYPLVSPPASRAAWFDAVRKAVIATNLPHSIWGYDDAMGLGRTITDGKVVLDSLTVRSFYHR